MLQSLETGSAARHGEEFVRFCDVEKSYDGRTLVVKRFDLAIRRGEFLTLLGPSGSGKTTSLMMLAGFEVPTRGSILLDGKTIDRLPPHRRNIGVVFQNYALFPHMTVAENLAFPLQMRRVPRSDRSARIARALDMVRMRGMEGRHPAQLSGGQQQRVALARALVFEPTLVLMDEPLGALDKQLREEMQLEIKHLHEELGITVVYVTHDQGEALTMSDRIAVFNDGVVQQVAKPNEIYERPANPFVARFIGDNNAIDGRVIAVAPGRCAVEASDGTVLEAATSGSFSPGADITVSVRPERIRIAPGRDLANRAEARVEEVIYSGDHVRVRFAAFGRDDLMLKVPSGAGPVDLRRGCAVPVGWAAEDCRALARE